MPGGVLRVVEAVLPAGVLGAYDAASATVWVARGLLRAQRRSTLAHERAHHARGDAASGDRVADARAEAAAERGAAVDLLPLRGLAAAVAGGGDEVAAAAELGVDVPLLRARLAGLTPAERGLLDEVVRAADAQFVAHVDQAAPAGRDGCLGGPDDGEVAR